MTFCQAPLSHPAGPPPLQDSVADRSVVLESSLISQPIEIACDMTSIPSLRCILKPLIRHPVRAFAISGVLAICADTALHRSLAAQAGAGLDTASLAPGTVFRDCPSCPEMIVIPAGTFIVGSPESEKGRLRAVYDQEGTAVRWTVIDELEPVINVNWDDAHAYLAWLSQEDG